MTNGRRTGTRGGQARAGWWGGLLLGAGACAGALLGAGAAGTPGSALGVHTRAGATAPVLPPTGPGLPAAAPASWEYASLSWESDGRWQFNSPGGNAAAETREALLSALRVPVAKGTTVTDATVVNAIAAAGWELVSHTRTATATGESFLDGRLMQERKWRGAEWWFRRAR